MASSESIVSLACKVWPMAHDIAVTPHSSGDTTFTGQDPPEQFKLIVSDATGKPTASLTDDTLNGLMDQVKQLFAGQQGESYGEH